ncbi:MAG TPA: NAD(P)/FAD-dependent oxidoreductase [Acidobacteriaceae bacterium]|nr:NAD(P)/FAD-dependent oxidoreductase [Acidobacteriaceae bacterium]
MTASNPPAHYDVIIVGAGAAGLFCAIEAGRGGRRVLLLDHANRIGKKILISGGGRCNFTNLHTTAVNFLSANPHFAKSALARFTPADFLALVERHRISWHEKKLGQLFCDRTSSDIVSMLEQECLAANVTIQVGTSVLEISHGNSFHLRTPLGIYTGGALVIATGGLSIPKMGATPFGYRIAEQFGLRVEPCRPALVPLTFNADDLERYVDLAGVSTEVITSDASGRFREKLLFTHRGLSGPAVLQISSYWQSGQAIHIDLAPGQLWTSELRNRVAQRDLLSARATLRGILPHRLADLWLSLHPPRAWTNRALEEAESALHDWTIFPAGTEGYEKAEVTAGGVDTAELSARTMESLKVRGLYFIGEVVDVTGHLGGFNFQWAWASGAAAGRALAG